MPKGRAAYGHERKPKVEIDGIKFASPGEAERYLELMIRQLKGENIEVFLQPKFEIQPAFKKCHGVLFKFEEDYQKLFRKARCPVCGGKMILLREITYSADFKIVHGDGRIEIEDVKGWGGYTTPEFKLKRKLFEFKYPDLSLILLKRLGRVKRIQELKDERDSLK